MTNLANSQAFRHWMQEKPLALSRLGLRARRLVYLACIDEKTDLLSLLIEPLADIVKSYSLFNASQII